MNLIAQLHDALHLRFPEVALEVDPPDNPAGRWFLDVRPGGAARWIIVEWQQDFGFGVSTAGEDDFWTKPDEIYLDVSPAYDRIEQLIISGEPTRPPTPVQLAELRRSRQAAQATFADADPAASQIEERRSILPGSPRGVVVAPKATPTTWGKFAGIVPYLTNFRNQKIRAERLLDLPGGLKSRKDKRGGGRKKAYGSVNPRRRISFEIEISDNRPARDRGEPYPLGTSVTIHGLGSGVRRARIAEIFGPQEARTYRIKPRRQARFAYFDIPEDQIKVSIIPRSSS